MILRFFFFLHSFEHCLRAQQIHLVVLTGRRDLLSAISGRLVGLVFARLGRPAGTQATPDESSDSDDETRIQTRR